MGNLTFFACGSGAAVAMICASMHVSPGVTLGQLNTQVAEQVNALLENVRTQVCITSTRKAYDHTCDYPQQQLLSCRWHT